MEPKRFSSLCPLGWEEGGAPGRDSGCIWWGWHWGFGSFLQCFDWERIGTEMVNMTGGSGDAVLKARPLMAKCWPRPAVASLLSQI